MKTPTFFAWCALLLVALGTAACQAQKVGKLDEFQNATKAPAPTPAAPPQFNSPTAPGASQVYVYEEKPIPGRPALVPPEQAQAIIHQFKNTYPKMGSPRFLIYVNPALVDQPSGLKPIAQTDSKQPGEGNNDRPAPTLADKQTVRDVERLIGRPLRMANAKLTDQASGTQLLPGGAIHSLGSDSEQARHDREALSKIAEIAIEVLISSREVRTAGLTGEQVYAVPDIQVTAIQLSDASIVGQASSADLSGGNPSPIFARSYGVHEITEATALALMQDMLNGFEEPTNAPDKGK